MITKQLIYHCNLFISHRDVKAHLEETEIPAILDFQ